MFNNLLKSGNIVKNDEARVIDSNTKVAQRLQYLSEILQESSDPGEFVEGFSEGLDALQVEQLLGEPEAEAEGAPVFDTQAFEEMKAEAQSEADAILNAAREEAESIIANANSQAEDIREKAKSSGHEEGYNAGYDEGMEIARQAEEKCAIREQELEAYYGQKIDELEPMFVDKITAIYEQVFDIGLSDKKKIVHYLIADAMRNIEGSRDFFIHVSKEDYEYVLSQREELTKGLPGTSTVEIIEDLTLSETQCFIEADSGIFDCGLGTELSLLKNELMLLSYRQ